MSNAAVVMLVLICLTLLLTGAAGAVYDARECASDYEGDREARGFD